MSPATVNRRETPRWLLFAMACALSSGPGSSAAAVVNDTGADAVATAAAATAEPRRVAWPCAPADSAGACLFKGLLQNALRLFAAANRRHGAAPETAAVLQTQSKGIEEYLLEQIQNLFGMFSFGFDLPAEVTAPWTLLKSSLFGKRLALVPAASDSLLSRRTTLKRARLSSRRS